MATLVELLFEAFGRLKRSPSPWPRAVRGALEADERARQALAPVCGPDGPPFLPDCLVPRPDAFLLSFDDELDRLAVVPGDVLVDQLEVAGLSQSAWSLAAAEPDRWLADYRRALELAWEGVRSWWERAAPLVEREVERVGVLLARGSLDELLAGLYQAHEVIRPAPRARRGRAGQALQPWVVPTALAPDLVLVPMMVGPGGSLVGADGKQVSYLGYPLPGARRLVTDDTPPRNGANLDHLLGAPRAAILRRLDRSMSAGQLAGQLLFTPAAISHHLKALERAGLAVRERNGQRVLVHRSARGTALLNMYEA